MEHGSKGLWGGPSSEGDAEIEDEMGGARTVEGMETHVECALPSEQCRSASGFGASGVMSYPGATESGRGSVAEKSLG